jgi:2-succinyl-6-hydroxy-2,4-cyclohexadiene-1-carboxylate synthase
MPELIRFNVRACGTQGGAPLLLFHGFMGCSADWKAVASVLHGDRYILAFDLPGHGGTEVLSDEGYRMDRCAEELIGWLDQCGIDKCSAIGYSMGGRLALYLAVTYPERFESIVVESASPGLKSDEDRAERRKSDAALIDKLRSRTLEEFVTDWYRQPLFATLSASPAIYQEMIKRRLRNKPERLALSLAQMGAGAQESLWNQLGKISARVMLVAGEDDTKYRTILGEVHGLIAGSKFAVVAQAGHNTHLENPEGFVEVVNSFLGK